MSSRSVSRRDFLRLAGASGIAAFVGWAGISRFSNSKNTENQQSAHAQSTGSWELAQDTTASPIHASYLPNGMILYIAGSGFHTSHRDGPFEARLLDPETNLETDVLLNSDLFCHGSSFLANGNLLIAGWYAAVR